MTTAAEVREGLRARLERAGVTVDASVIDALENYFWLLARWNLKVNLTALPLDPPRDETFDRLFVEPLVAANHLALPARSEGSQTVWVDLGSGGGSPAIPMKILRPSWRLTMVEAKERKAAFLREAARGLRLDGVEVANTRFEDFRPATRVDLVTIRAVKPDELLADVVQRLLNPSGIAALFSSTDTSLRGLETVQVVSLVPERSAVLTVMRVPRGTHSG